jgi:hypothetical protein
VKDYSTILHPFKLPGAIPANFNKGNITEISPILNEEYEMFDIKNIRTDDLYAPVSFCGGGDGGGGGGGWCDWNGDGDCYDEGATVAAGIAVVAAGVALAPAAAAVAGTASAIGWAAGGTAVAYSAMDSYSNTK